MDSLLVAPLFHVPSDQLLGIPLVPVLSSSNYSSPSSSAPLSSSFSGERNEGGGSDLPYSNASHYLGQIKNVRLPLAKVRAFFFLGENTEKKYSSLLLPLVFFSFFFSIF